MEIGFGATLLLSLAPIKGGHPLGNAWKVEYPETNSGEEAACREPALLRT